MICDVRTTLILLFFLSRSSSEENIKKKPGENADLACKGPTKAVVELLQWKKPDLKSDDYVFYFKDEHPYENFQNPSYRGRVKLRDPKLTSGDLSIIVNNITINDAGIYECILGQQGKLVPINKINLTVVQGDNKDVGNKENHLGLIVSLSLAAVLLFAAVVGFMIYRKRQEGFL